MIDLHTHSTASDGTDPPATVVALAGEAGVSALALTDHDTLEGLPEAIAAGEAASVRVVPGCELSLEVEQGTLHLLVLFLEGDDGPLQSRLGALRAGRDDRNLRIVDALVAEGLDVSIDEVLDVAGGGSVGRPHVAAVLMEKGYVTSIQDAFDRWLAKGRPGYVERDRLHPDEAIELAHASGAVAVAAHPFSVVDDADALDRFIAELAALGLDGIEVEYGRYDADQRTELARVAARHGLAPSGGSDYHGAYKPGLAVGTGLGDLNVPDAWLDDLEARRPARP